MGPKKSMWIAYQCFAVACDTAADTNAIRLISIRFIISYSNMCIRFRLGSYSNLRIRFRLDSYSNIRIILRLDWITLELTCD